MGKEVENIILENIELLATKYVTELLISNLERSATCFDGLTIPFAPQKRLEHREG